MTKTAAAPAAPKAATPVPPAPPAPPAPAAAAAPAVPPPPAAPVAAKPAFTLDTGLAVPTIARTIGQPSSYPFAIMQVGQSFLAAVEGEGDAFKAEARKVANRLSGAIRRFRENDANKGLHFAIRTVNDAAMGKGVRVWRVAEEEKTEAGDGASA